MTLSYSNEYYDSLPKKRMGEDSDIAAIQLPADELSEFGFFSQAALPEAMTKPLRSRVLAAWQQYDCSQTAYLEDQMFV